MFRRIKQLVGLVILFISKFSLRSVDLNIYGSWFGEKFSDNSAYLFLTELEKEGKKNIWITKNRLLKRQLKEEIPIEYAYSIRGIFYQLRAKNVYVSTSVADVEKNLIGGANVINLWHGIPLKKVMYDVSSPGLEEKIRLKATNNFVTCSSLSLKSIYMSAFNVDDSHCLVTGQPRTDIFFNNTDTFALLRRSLASIENKFLGKKIVLYAPTHRSEGKESIEIEKLIDLNKLNLLMIDRNYIFMIKKHFYHRNDTPIGNYSNILDITKEDIDTQVLLNITDILITDYSSIYIDFLLKEKPIIFFRYDLERYLIKDRALYFEYEMVTPGIKVKDGNTLLETIEYLTRNEYQYKEQDQQITDLFFDYKDGNASSRVVSEILFRNEHFK
ncbi:CDP-glycerol glycerophosphotransferase family protein [Enterococcus faecium]|nr:CDP-glycerol glycerophosphotransferase family protein [Enterococcus faecium]EMF0544119.1 CDP-glycerol glycerophosphotransferase family protein [Enterococcus faecium]MBC9703679.1 CDP-glycerol glycerophosphotransferase family protein [Enterococcus sp.]